MDTRIVLGERYNVKVSRDYSNDDVIGGTFIGKKKGYSYFKLNNGKFAHGTNYGSHYRVERIGENISTASGHSLSMQSLEEMVDGHRNNVESLLSKLEEQEGALQNA